MTVLAQISDFGQRAVDAARARSRFGHLPPGPPEPAMVQTAEWLARPVDFLERAHERYGDVFTMRLVGIDPFVLFSDPDAVKDIFTGPPDDLYAGEANAVLEPILGPSSVLLLDGQRHMSQRRLLLPPFHGQRMRAYGEVIRDATLRSLAKWPRGRAFAVHPYAQGITLDVILRTVFGVDEDAAMCELSRPIEVSAAFSHRGIPARGAAPRSDTRSIFGRALRAGRRGGLGADELTSTGLLSATLTDLLERLANPIWLLRFMQFDLGPYSPGGRLARLLEQVDRQLYALIRARRAQDREGREDILTMLLDARHEDGAPMSDQELRDELLTLLVAGHETTATSLAWTLHRLLETPDVLARAVEEVDRVFGGEVDPERVRELTWIDAIAKETLRLNPVVPLVGRRLQKPMRFGNTELPAGVVAVPNIYLTHRNPRAWKDPTRFDPARFVDAKISPSAFFPFGGGVRRCIGMAFALYEMQVVLATLLSRVRIRRPAGKPVRLVRRAITFAPSGGMPLIVEDR